MDRKERTAAHDGLQTSSENCGTRRNISGAKNRLHGWLALSPLFVFLAVYLATSLIAKDFYKVPISAAFVIASVWAFIITPGNLENRISAFSRGAGNKNVLLMIWIFVLAGAFASTAKSIGAIEATVNLTLRVLPPGLILTGFFVAACFISMSIGTSVGTIVALVPITTGIAQQTGTDLGLVTATIVGGAFFGDNLSFISDTTIAATKTQGCSMSDKFRANFMIAAISAMTVAGIYLIIGHNISAAAEVEPVKWTGLIPYLAIIILALSGVNVLIVLCLGLCINMLIGFFEGTMGWTDFLGAIGQGIGGMGDLIIVTMLAGGMLELIKDNGGLDFIIRGLTKHIRGKRGAEFSIAGLVSITNLCTANNTVAIITTGHIAREISQNFGIDPRRAASILDTFSCVFQGLIPYGAQMLMASGLAGISAISIISHLYYPVTLGIVFVISILMRFPRKYC